MRPLIRHALLAAVLALPAAAHADPAPGDPVDIVPFGVVKTWRGPDKEYPKGMHLPVDVALAPLDPARGAGWTVEGDAAGANIGIEWDEHRFFDRLVMTFAPGSSPSSSDDAELQIWGTGKPPEKGHGVIGADSPFFGWWTKIDARPETAGNTWTWRLPPHISAPGRGRQNETFGGTLQVRVLFRNRPAAAVATLQAFSASRWKPAEVTVRFPGMRFEDGKLTDKTAVEVQNGRLLGLATATAHHVRLRLLATDAPAGSPDRTIVTLRGPDTGVSFYVDDALQHAPMWIPGLRSLIGLDDLLYSHPEPAGKTVRQRVAEMPEQTYEGALRSVPPKERTKWLALAPGSHMNKFAVRPNGNAFPRQAQDFEIQFATGDDADYNRREPQRVEEDHLPVLIAEWEEGPIRWKQEYVVVLLASDRPEAEWRGDETTALVTRITAGNRADTPRVAKAHVRFWKKNAPVELHRGEGGFLNLPEQDTFACLETGGAEAAQDGSTLSVPLALDPGASRAVELRIASPGSDWAEIHPDARVKKLAFSEARRWTVDYWTRRLAAGASFTVPEEKLNRTWKSLLIHQSMWGDQDPKRGWLPNVAAFVYGPVGNESSQMVKALDLYGDPAMARKYLDPMCTQQGSDDINARVESDDGILVGYWAHYTFNTGFILWNGANHYRFTRDADWLRRVAPKWVKACDWIARERRTTMQTDRQGRRILGYGFFPPCSLEDLPVWQYWTMTNAYLAGGMRHAAEALADIGHPDAARLAEEARAFQADVAAGVREATIRCPVVRLQDGFWTPYIPKHLHQRGRPVGEGDKGDYEAELGALHLASMDIFPPASPEVTATLDFHEDVVYLTEAHDHRSIIDLSRIREDWFHLGGYGKTQPYLVHTAMTHLRRDEPKHALRSFYNNLVAQNYADINAFPEHISRSGAADCKTYEEAMALQQFRSLLLHEEGDELWICPAASRHWFADGREIRAERAPTHFGPVAFTVRSEAAKGRIIASIDPPRRNPPHTIRLRLRHPEEKPMRRVTVNGAEVPRVGGASRPDTGAPSFNPAKEWIGFPPSDTPIEVAAEY